MLARELRKKKIEDLRVLEKETKDKIEKAKLDLIQEKETNLQKIRDLKKDCARILTVINEKRRKENA